ncbi:MAG TPA: Zn-ribbon domain-containing OB-fold protein [Xanthobacteraceae bacterium]|nr:Zn-ribbon domain-containing OB-fold protein [Xanthobacteraceae bacterium]
MNAEVKPRMAPRANVYVNTDPFWQAAQKRELVIQYCKDSGKFQHYPRPVSIYTGKRNLEWRKVSGKGTIYAHTTIRIPGPGLDGRLPLPVATVELDEGVRMIANIIETDAADIKVGAKVEVAWDKITEDFVYPAFKVVKG